MEYCFTATGACSGWFNSLPTQINLPSSDGNGTYIVQSQYRLVFGGYYYPSPPNSFTITLILPNTPNVSLSSPVGILDPSGATLLQSQNINGTVGQWVTYTASSPVGAQLNITADGSCGTPCGPLLGGVSSGPPFMWLWTGSAQPPADTYVTITATDDAGNTNTTVPVSTSAFSLFTPGSSGIGLTCNGSTGNCVTLADQVDNDIPGDSPSPSVGECSDASVTFQFSGYGDPSMRAEQLVPDSDGVDLWLLYSYPNYNWSVPYRQGATQCSDTTTVETHLAGSIANSGPNGGASWMAYCSGQPCNGSSAPATPIFPSEPYCSTEVWPINGTKYTCQQVCKEGPVVNEQERTAWSTCFSSHEVPNFWPYVNTNANPMTETWFAVHLMYWVGQGTGISTTSIANGCLVVSMAPTGDSPSSLGWSLGSGPNTCSGTFPAGSQALLFTTLDTLTGQNCNSWGEPAIMIAPYGSQYAIYLAASCINGDGASAGYYIFNSQAFTTPPANTQWTWSNYAGPFTWQNVPLGTISQGGTQQVNSLTEFDWAVRADGSMVAIVTPMYVAEGAAGTSSESFQYGCLAINFYLTKPTGLFGTVTATLNDADQASPYDELYGSNGCTYEPMSNTGVVIGRRLVDTNYNGGGLFPSENETYSLINTGVLP